MTENESPLSCCPSSTDRSFFLTSLNLTYISYFLTYREVEIKKITTKRITRSRLVILRLKAEDPETLYARLKWVAQHKQYSKGWIAHKFHSIRGEWPEREYRLLGAVKPSSDLLIWLERERRAYGLRMKVLDKEFEEETTGHLDRIEAVLSDLESNPFAHNAEYSDPTDIEPYAIVSRLMKMREP